MIQETSGQDDFEVDVVDPNRPRMQAAMAIPRNGPRSDPEDLVGVTAQASLIDYQKGAVVSRTLLKQSGGTITAFAFDAGEGLSEHTAPFDAFVLMVEGEAEVSLSGEPRRVKAGELVKLPANQPHALRAATRFKMILVMIRA